MLSMTGFGSGRAEAAGQVVTVQIASVNGRGCRVTVRGDLRDLGSEERLRSRVQEALRRGSVTVQVGCESAADATGLDLSAIAATWRALAGLASELGADRPGLDAATRLAVPARPSGRGDADPALLEAALEQALTAIEQMRRQEGAALQQVLREQAARLRTLRDAMLPVAAARLQRRREQLGERLAELLGTQVPEEVLVREVAVYADRLDITEEIDRLASHLDQLDRLLDGEPGQGRAIEFLLQEIGREINTTGSKANDATLQALVVEAKTVLEQVREQVANVL